MRSFGALAWRQITARPVRAFLTAAGIVLGVAMIFAVLTLSATVQNTFDDLFASVYGRTDLIVAGEDQTSLGPAISDRVAAVDGVAAAEQRLLGIFVLVGPDGRASEDPGSTLNIAGEDPRVDDLTDSRIVSGRRVRNGNEVNLQDSWADSQGIELGDRVRFATPAGVKALRVVGLFEFSTGLEFGGQGFGLIPLRRARSLLDRPRGSDEIAVAVDPDADPEAVARQLRRALPSAVKVQTPAAQSEDVQAQLQGFDTVIFFFAAMALFVGGFLIYNSFNMTVLQRTREIGMLRTVGARRGAIVALVEREALILGTVGSLFGLGLGLGLTHLLVELLRASDLPVGKLDFTPTAPIAAVVTGVGTAAFGALIPALRASRVPPIQAVLGTEGLRGRPRPLRGLIGVTLIAAGAAGAYNLGAADQVSNAEIAGGMAGTLGVFLGIALVAPFLIGPMVRVLSAPARWLLPAEGRLAADAARSDAIRTAATATGLLIGLALVVAIQTLGSSFLRSIEDELDRTFARDLTVQPRGFSPGAGPQQSISHRVSAALARIDEAKVVAPQRMLFVEELPEPPPPDQRSGSKTSGVLFAFDPDVFDQVDQTTIEDATREQAFAGLKKGGVTIGRGLADEYGIGVGDTLLLDGPAGKRRAPIVGIVRTVFAGGQTVGMSLATIERIYGVTADSLIAIKARSEQDRAALRSKVDRLLANRFPNLEALSNEEVKADAEDQFQQVFGFFGAIVAVAVIASLFGIINTLSMSVFERTREIGVLRALGATRRQIRRTIAIESLMIGLIGALLGIGVGAAIGWALLKGLAAGVPGVTYTAPISTIVGVVIAGIVLGLLASILPARRAARQDVIDALGYE